MPEAGEEGETGRRESRQWEWGVRKLLPSRRTQWGEIKRWGWGCRTAQRRSAQTILWAWACRVSFLILCACVFSSTWTRPRPWIWRWTTPKCGSPPRSPSLTQPSSLTPKSGRFARSCPSTGYIRPCRAVRAGGASACKCKLLRLSLEGTAKGCMSVSGHGSPQPRMLRRSCDRHYWHIKYVVWTLSECFSIWLKHRGWQEKK